MTAPVITGSWIDILHPCPRDGVYWNRKTLAYNEADWLALVRHLKHDLGIDLLMIQNVARDGVALYPSTVMAKQWPTGCADPVGAIFRACSAEGVDLYPGVGYMTDSFGTAGFDATSPESERWHREVSQELLDRYGKEPSFAGFYMSSELGLLDGRFKPEQIAFTAGLTAMWRSLLPDRPSIGSPWTHGPVARTSELVRDIAATGLDVIAYQDHAGFSTKHAPVAPDVGAALFSALAWAHARTPVKLWANTELFRFENDIPFQPLLPGPFDRIRVQLRSAAPHVERVVAYTVPGIMTSQAVCPGLGDPSTENLYREYRAYLRNHGG